MESTFRKPVPDGTQLIETFRFEPGKGFIRLELHLARMRHSANAFGFRYDIGKAEALLADVGGAMTLRCRLTLGADARFALTTAPLPADPPVWAVAFAQPRVSADDPWLRHKTTNRAVFEAQRAAMREGLDEVIFLNERGEVTEGTITNVFVTLEGGQKVTPPLSSGLLPGVLRRALLDKGEVTEKVLSAVDLTRATALEIGNSLRGLRPAVLRPLLSP